MSPLTEQALAQTRQLPTRDHEAIASITSQEPESEQRCDGLFARPGSTGLTARTVDQALPTAKGRRGTELFSRKATGG